MYNTKHKYKIMETKIISLKYSQPVLYNSRGMYCKWYKKEMGWVKKKYT